MENLPRILKFTTCGIKNIDKPISLLFSNRTIEKGVKKFTNVKDVFGYNGSGKTAIMTSILLYKRIITDDRYLLQDITTSKLDKLMNKKTKEFSFDVVFDLGDEIVKHHILLKHDSLANGYVIKNEALEICKGRTLDENWELVASSNDGVVKVTQKYITNEIGELDYFDKNKFVFGSFLLGLMKLLASKRNAFKGPMDNSLVCLSGRLFVSIIKIDVFLVDDDKHDSCFIDIENMMKMMKTNWSFLKSYSTPEFCIGSVTIKKANFKDYEKKIARAAKFIQLFKPSLLRIDVTKKENGDFYQINNVFVYKDYGVDFEFESSGIKHLIKMFDALDACANGKIVFIDEMDANINSVYFQKLIEFFQKYGKGQLCFTSHDLLVMSSLKKQGKAISVVGDDCKIDAWSLVGNNSPIKYYQNGFFPNSPMNIEDFDFLPIFFSEEEGDSECRS